MPARHRRPRRRRWSAAFLTHLEQHRGNSVRTRNARLAAIHSLFRFAALRHPEHAELIARVLAIPPKRCDAPTGRFLTPPRSTRCSPPPTDAPGSADATTPCWCWPSKPDCASRELTALRTADLHLGAGPHVRCHGKGRKERVTPLTRQTVAVLRDWMRERDGAATDPLFPTRNGPRSASTRSSALSPSTSPPQRRCPSLRDKTVSPHVLRHTCAMNLLRAGVDIATIALWLGHEDIETTQIYLHADLALKETRARPHHPTPHHARSLPARPTRCSPSSTACRLCRAPSQSPPTCQRDPPPPRSPRHNRGLGIRRVMPSSYLA